MFGNIENFGISSFHRLSLLFFISFDHFIIFFSFILLSTFITTHEESTRSKPVFMKIALVVYHCWVFFFWHNKYNVLKEWCKLIYGSYITLKHVSIVIYREWRRQTNETTNFIGILHFEYRIATIYCSFHYV